jgi:hypothetical protein
VLGFVLLVLELFRTISCPLVSRWWETLRILEYFCCLAKEKTKAEIGVRQARHQMSLMPGYIDNTHVNSKSNSRLSER